MNQDIIVEKLIEKIRNLPDGTEIESMRFFINEVFNLKESLYCDGKGYTYIYESFELEEKDFLKIYGKLMQEIENENISLDFSKWDGQIVGLPYNLSFVIKKANENEDY